MHPAIFGAYFPEGPVIRIPDSITRRSLDVMEAWQTEILKFPMTVPMPASMYTVPLKSEVVGKLFMYTSLGPRTLEYRVWITRTAGYRTKTF